MLVLDNVRSAHNVGALLRTAEGLGVKTVYTCGLTPHPKQVADARLPHVIAAAEQKLAKTALGAERTLKITHYFQTKDALADLRESGWYIVGLEQAPGAVELSRWRPPQRPLALVLGHELNGLSEASLAKADALVMLPMRGQKESFNVAAAGAMAMYQLAH